MLHVPRLPAIQYYDRAQFPWMDVLEAQTEAIRTELIGLREDDAEGFKPYVTHPAGAPLNQWAELNWSPRWSALYLWKDGKRLDANCARCPKTAEALAAIPRADIPNFAPTAFFSTLDAHTRIPPHSGDTNVRLIVHLPLIVPGQCYFRVGNDTAGVQTGSHAWVFDDSIEHEAWNDSDRQRVILIFDVWNPYLSEAEREMVGELLNGVNALFLRRGVVAEFLDPRFQYRKHRRHLGFVAPPCADAIATEAAAYLRGAAGDERAVARRLVEIADAFVPRQIEIAAQALCLRLEIADQRFCS